MATSYNKKEREKKRLKKREEKQKRKEERKSENSNGSLDSMMAYVDEFGNITDTPPDPNKKKKTIKAKDIEIGVPKQDTKLNEELRGKVSSFNYERGFGFITTNDSNRQYFVHESDLTESLEENDKVSFKGIETVKGFQAIDIKKI